MWDNDLFRGSAVRTWLKIDYGQLHVRIESMWLRRVYFVLSKFLRTKILSPK
jgi:hypothetical protein